MSDEPTERPMVFSVLRGPATEECATRLGRLALPNRQPLDTPNFFAISSRGAVPHLTPDVLSRSTEIAGTYMALEDFMDRSGKTQSTSINVLGQTHESSPSINTYTAMPDHVATVLGPRRHPAAFTPKSNGQKSNGGSDKKSISILASTGYQNLTNEAYGPLVRRLKADITIPLADLSYTYDQAVPNIPGKQRTPNAKRQERMVERTSDWLIDFLKLFPSGDDTTSIFAPLLPASHAIQWDHLNRLAEDHVSHLAGLAVYDTDILADIDNYPPLVPLPRLSLESPVRPQEILRQLRLGVDVFTIPFLNIMSDMGIALTFKFPAPTFPDEKVQPLGIDMWSPDHQTAVEPLLSGCGCYTCTKHHRAFLHHLLNAKEMLGWTLLQIHNHQVLSNFFIGVRGVLASEPSRFEELCSGFERRYEAELPEGSNGSEKRPRARGYHFKPEPSSSKINKSTWENLKSNDLRDNTLEGEVAGLAVTGALAGGDDTPVAAEGDADELNKKGFGKPTA